MAFPVEHFSLWDSARHATWTSSGHPPTANTSEGLLRVELLALALYLQRVP